MAKLQMIQRANMSRVFSVNIPQEYIQLLNWQKADNIEVSVEKSVETGRYRIILRKPEEDDDRDI